MTDETDETPTPISEEVARQILEEDLAPAVETATEGEAQPEEPTGPQYFESALGEAVQSIYTNLMAMRARGVPGALRHGPTGAHIIVQEIIDNATSPQAYLTAATYAVAAALLGVGFWELPTIQAPEQPVEEKLDEAIEKLQEVMDDNGDADV